MPRIKKIEQRTLDFIGTLKYMEDNGKKIINKDLAERIGIKSPSGISEMKGKRQNIQPEQWDEFKKLYNTEISEYVALRKHHDFLDAVNNEDSPVTKGEMSGLFLEIMDKLSDIHASLQNNVQISRDSNSLARSALLKLAEQEGKAEGIDPGKIFEGSLKAAEQILKLTYGSPLSK